MKSMTGFGSGKARLDSGRGAVTVEVKSINQRFLDLKLMLPKEYAAWEPELRKEIQNAVARGRVEVSVSRLAGSSRRSTLAIDVELARAIVDEWRRLKKRLRLAGEVDLSFLRGVPDLFRPIETRWNPDAERAAARAALRAALRQLDRSRAREGKHLERDMRVRVTRLEALAEQMAVRAQQSLAVVRERAASRVRELLESKVDEGRIIQEAALVAERGDVTEEIVRLRSHLAGLRSLFSEREPVGKRIDFLLQEVHREVNTVASKSADLELTKLAVEAKGEIEKIREQVQNVE